MGSQRLRRVLAAVLPITLLVPLLLVGVSASPAPAARTNPIEALGTDLGLPPPTITPQLAWDGIDYNHTCGTCLPADPQVASSPGYVFEMANGSYSIWNPTGTLLASGTLDSLFNAGSDSLIDPQVRYVTTDQRWFASVDDVHSNNVLYGVSPSSDPVGTWNIQHFNIGFGATPAGSTLGVNAINVVVSTNLYSRPGGAYLGAQVFVANESQLANGGGVATWSSSLTASEEALVPAQPATATKTMYLVSDGTGSAAALDLFTLTGSPPGTPTLSAPVSFSTSTTKPPNAVQSRTSDLVNVGDGRIQSAVWRAGTLWAAATDGCVPAGDSVLRSCLHLWEVATIGSTMTQDFVWSSGKGTYDFYPAPATNGTGQLTVVYGQSSATLDPSVFVTGQTSADAAGTLEPGALLKQGVGPDAPGASCIAGVCPFGSSFGAAFEPFSGDRFWVVGEYTGPYSSVDFWSTWVAQVSNVVSYPVTFSEVGLDVGQEWSVTLNGITENSSASTIDYLEPNGTYTYSVGTPIRAAAGVRYVDGSPTGSFALTSAGLTQPVNFTQQFRLTTIVLPHGAGSIDPAGGWFDASSSVLLGALANSSHAFHSWTGSGDGAYNGSSNPANITLYGPINETANFVNSTTFSVTLHASGLPTNTVWSATLNGLEESTPGSELLFNVTNGSYTYVIETPIAGGVGTQYSGAPAAGTLLVSASDESVPVTFTTEYLLSTSVLPISSGAVSPMTAWFPALANVNLSALPASGFAFASWSGVGSASYTGTADPVSVTMGGPISETADFVANGRSYFEVTFGVTPVGSGSILFDGQTYSNAQPLVVPGGAYALASVTQADWEFAQWEAGGGVSIGADVATITGSGWINASFVAVDHVSISTDPASCGSISVAGNVYANGASLELAQGTYSVSANACASYTIDSVSGQGGVRVDQNQLTISGNGSIVATFSQGASGSADPFSAFGSQVPLWLLIIAIGLLYATLAVLYFEKRRTPPGGSASNAGRTGAPAGAAVAGVARVPAAPIPPWSEESEAPPAGAPDPPK